MKWIITQTFSRVRYLMSEIIKRRKLDWNKRGSEYLHKSRPQSAIGFVKEKISPRKKTGLHGGLDKRSELEEWIASGKSAMNKSNITRYLCSQEW